MPEPDGRTGGVGSLVDFADRRLARSFTTSRTAAIKDTDADQPRNLAKSVTAE